MGRQRTAARRTLSAMTETRRGGPATVIDEWRAFVGPRYRRFLGIGVGQAAVSALAGDGLTIPLLLTLGAHPALATVIGVLPFAFSSAQLLVPRLLRQFDGNLRGVTLAILLVGETRGFILAAFTFLAWAGILPEAGRDHRDRAGHDDGRRGDDDRRGEPAGLVWGDPARPRATLRRAAGHGREPGTRRLPAAARRAAGPGDRVADRCPGLRPGVRGGRDCGHRGAAGRPSTPEARARPGGVAPCGQRRPGNAVRWRSLGRAARSGHTRRRRASSIASCGW